jgi:hypothetical protein
VYVWYAIRVMLEGECVCLCVRACVRMMVYLNVYVRESVRVMVYMDVCVFVCAGTTGGQTNLAAASLAPRVCATNTHPRNTDIITQMQTTDHCGYTHTHTHTHTKDIHLIAMPTKR